MSSALRNNKIQLVLIALAVIIIPMLSFGLYLSTTLRGINNLRDQKKLAISKVINEAIRSSLSDIKLLSRQKEEEIPSLFPIVLKTHRRYSQGRILNERGFEVLRYNAYSTRIENVPTNKLQDKSKRQYFLKAKNLRKNEVYLSPLNYNIENGIPQKDHIVFRIATKNQYNPNKIIILNSSTNFLETFIKESKSVDLSLEKERVHNTFVSLMRGQMIIPFKLAPLQGLNKNLKTSPWQFNLKLNLKNERAFFLTISAIFSFLLLSLGILLLWLKISKRKQEELTQIFEKLVNQNYYLRILAPNYQATFANRKVKERFQIPSDKEIDSFYEKTIKNYFSLEGDETERKQDPKLSLLAGKTWQGRVSYKLPTGTTLWFQCTKAPLYTGNDLIGYGVLEEDITDQVELEQETQKQQKAFLQTSVMANIGKMSSILSHQFSTPISVLMSGFDILENEIKKKDPNWSIIERKIHQFKETLFEMDELSNYIKRLARVSQTNNNGEAPFASLIEIIQYSLRMTKNSAIKEGIEIKVSDEEMKGVQVEGSVILMSQVFINLIQNSIQAIQDNQNKWIKIQLERNQHKNENDDGSFISIRFTDSGKGISKEDSLKIFDPFYSTKDYSEGSGLGLSIVRQILSSSQGKITVDHNYENTSFIIKLKKRGINHD